jgi:DNA (cytosine-5)-methyltransferase 1
MRDVDRPAPTLLATADKTPVYLVMTETGQKAIRIFDDDIEIVKKIKVFMALYGITNIKMRMLRVDELLKIQGFPDDYMLMGSQTNQKKFIGNSVVPNVVKAWALAMGSDLVKTNAA